jgi:hypothetical protein
VQNEFHIIDSNKTSLITAAMRAARLDEKLVTDTAIALYEHQQLVTFQIRNEATITELEKRNKLIGIPISLIEAAMRKAGLSPEVINEVVLILDPTSAPREKSVTEQAMIREEVIREFDSSPEAIAAARARTGI